VIIRRNVLGNFALAGVEVANWGNNALVSNILIEENYIYGGGRGWSGTGDNDNNTEGVVINGKPSHENIRIVRNVIDDINHSGIRIQDVDATGIEVLQNQISRCRYGIRNFAGQVGYQEVNASFNEISSCSNYGILHDQRLGTAVCEYRKNTLVDNGTANLAILRTDNAKPVVKDNNCYGAQYGIQKTGNLNVVPQFNNAYGASGQNYAGIQADQTNESVDPKFQNYAEADYQLLENSPLVDGASGTSLGNDLIDQVYTTDDTGCHAVIHETIDVNNLVNLEALTG
jgi:hypothetical protein